MDRRRLTRLAAAPVRATEPARLPLFALLSLMAHAAAVYLMLPHTAVPSGPVEQPAIEIELVDQAAEQKGGAGTLPSAPPPVPPLPPADTPQAPPEALAPPPLQEGGDENRPAPPNPDTVSARAAGPPPAPPQPQTPPGPVAVPSTVNLVGAGAEDREPLQVTGRNVVPPRPDALVRNKPPNYPADAARRGAQGIVVLVIHVTPLGLPAWVDIKSSSGDASLDRAARQAVALWRFEPARQNGVAVAFDYELPVRFTLDR